MSKKLGMAAVTKNNPEVYNIVGDDSLVAPVRALTMALPFHALVPIFVNAGLCCP
jgi:hypothetical protein